MKRIVAIVLALSLAACATYKNPITKSRVDALDASWGGALSLADGYYDACERRLIAPSCRTNVDKMHRAAEPIHEKVKMAREYALNPTISQKDLILIASDAVNGFKVLQMELGVK